MINFPSQLTRRAWTTDMRKACFASTMALTLGLSGCAGTFSGAGPFKSDIETTTDAYTLVDINASTIAPFMRRAQEPTLGTVANLAPAKTRLMAGDVIDVLITDNAAQGTALFAPLATGGTQLKVRIDHLGMISLPYVGRKKVAGMTPMQVETLIRRKLKGVTSDAQVHVELIADLSGSVLVAGAVKSPGRFSTLQGPLTLLDVINQAGGPIMEPHLVSVTVRSGSGAETMSYEDILAGNNSVLRPNSEVVVERSRLKFVAMGAVGRPGLHDLPLRNTSLLDALGAVGGLKEQSANAQGVFVFRHDELATNTPLVMRIDLRDPAAIFFAKRIVLKPDDTLYVTNAAVHEWQKVIAPIVQTLILGNALGNSAN